MIDDHVQLLQRPGPQCDGDRAADHPHKGVQREGQEAPVEDGRRNQARQPRVPDGCR